MHSLTDEEDLGRLQALYRCDIIGTAPDIAFDALASLAAYACAAPISLIGFIDNQREWFKSRVGLDLAELPINQSLDTPLLTRPQQLAVTTLAAPRFAEPPLMLGGASIRFYANAPIRSPDGFVIGAIAVADYMPRSLGAQQQEALSSLAYQIGALLELRTLRHHAGERRQQALLAELGKRALSSESITDLMEWVVRDIARALEVNRCGILELLPKSEALPRASFGWGAVCPSDHALPLAHYGLAAYALQADQPVVINDMANERRFGGVEILQDREIESGVILIIPGIARPYGLLSVYSAQRRSYTRADIAFLQSVTTMLADVITQRRRQQDHDSIINLSRVLRRATTRPEMMTIILAHIHAVCQSAGTAIILCDPHGQAFVAQSDGIWASATGTPIPAGSGPSWQVVQSGQPFFGDTPDFQLADTAPLAHAVACVALTYNDQPIGALWVAYPRVSSYYDQHLLATLADVIASAISRSDLHDEAIRLYQEHLQLTMEVRRTERYLANIVESAIDLVVSTDSDGQIMTWNRAAERAYGLPRDLVVGRYLRDLCSPADQAMIAGMIPRIIAGASFSQVELSLIGSTPQDVPVSWQLSAIQSETGASVGIVAIGRDLSDQRRMESQLIQAAKMASMGVMASGIGHELRNPLSIISANAQLAEERLPDQELIRTCLQQIHAATKRAALIIDNLLTFARPRNEGSQIVDVNEVLAATFMLLDHQIQQHHVELIATLSHAIPNVLGNGPLLQQVFTNVILNALQAMGGGGVLRVTTRVCAEPGVEVVFSDTGSGIPPDVLPRIFDPFFTTRPLGQGTGLGLAISYSIIKQHGGVIETYSLPGEGCTFCVRLPAAPTP
jgi:PAS domain S-box-containing protein